MTREEWLLLAVEKLNTEVFNNELDITNHAFQISCCKCAGKKHTEVFQPSDNEDIGLDDFFPTTIHIDFTINDPIKLLKELAFACMPAFFNMKPKGKLFKVTAEKYGFEYINGWEVSYDLEDTIKNVYKQMVREHGEFPGKAVKLPVKEKKEKKKSSYAIFCPDCGYEMKITRKIFEKHGKGLPTCPCGAKMGVDMDDEEAEV